MQFLPPNCSGIQELGLPLLVQPLKIQRRCQANNMIHMIKMLAFEINETLYY